MTNSTPTLPPQERVLSTLNKDGSRRWLHPRVSTGRFLTRRRWTAYALIATYNLLPWISINGKPAILLDLPARQFTFFGTTFLPTDTLLLMLFIAGVFVTVFLVTALFGRIWCGWACPQTVYMEFVYRPIERLFDGPPDRRKRTGGATGLRRVAKYVVYLLVSLHLAHTFLAYFVGAENLFDWTRQSPFEHPTAFLIVVAITALMMFDFGIFREQTCIVACPYGRFQSVMLDRSSLIISYDTERGEPRGRKRRASAKTDVALPVLGDCIDCHMCVTTCPTGIDIREGLQMECIGCAQCIDACDTVMDKIKRPRGLIRYSSQEAMEHRQRHLMRPRVILYPLLLLIIATLFTITLVNQKPADITVLRGQGVYSRLDSGAIRNALRVKIVNRTDATRRYEIGVDGAAGARIEVDGPIELEAGATVTTEAHVIVPADQFQNGRARLQIRVSDDMGFTDHRAFRAQGPYRTTETAPPAEENSP